MKMQLMIGMLFMLVSSLSLAEENKPRPNGPSILVRYHQMIGTRNSYENAAGEKVTLQRAVHNGSMGLGLAYDFAVNEQWTIFPEMTFLRVMNKDFRAADEITVMSASINIARSTQSGRFYGGLSTQRILGETEMKYSPAMGFRAGYQFDIGTRSTVSLGFDLWTFRSENPSGSVYNQKTETGSVLISYGFRI